MIPCFPAIILEATFTLFFNQTCQLFIQTYSVFDFSCVHVHLFWFSTTTRAATALQTQLAHPPPIPWPCATTTTLPQSTPSQLFAVSPVKTGTHSKILEFSLSCALGPHPYHLLHPPTTPSPGVTICAHSRTLAHLLRTFACIVHLAHLQRTLHTPSAHPHAPFCAPFPGLATHIWPSH